RSGVRMGCQLGAAFTWEVRANDRGYHRQFKKKFAFCLSKRKYSGNAIRTAKYNLLTFLPLNLYEQFHRMANVYFVFVILLQTFPEISTLPWYTLLFPLSCLLIIRGLRDLIDDILSPESPCSFRWQKCWLSEPSSLCYVETADIDGETNLKFRQALLVTHQELGSEESMAAFDGRVTCEEPNSRMHTFTGTLRWRGRTHALDIDRLLLRGCRVRNTALCYGLVLYAGFDSKIMRNCGKIKRKKTKLDHMMDRLVVVIFLVLLLTSLGLAVASGFWARTFQEKHSYLAALYKHTTPAQQAFLNFWGFTILLSIIIPMSMYITLEFIYLLNSCFINWDLEMYYGAKDIPAEARSTSLSDQLGQVEYIFSDKTGTLTQNIMSFKKCCVNGTIYGNPGWDKFVEDQVNLELRDDDPVLREFLRLLALCHTVMVEDRDQLVYQAASPDEEALVLAAKNLGYVFLARTQDTITIRELGSTRTYELLAMLDFNSDRKRMSVLVRDPQGTIRLYTKGADTVILDRLRRRGPNETLTERALDRFAEETLRTLCVASREVSEAEFRAWSQRHREATVLLQDRARELDRLYEEMEQNLQLLGATAIEDKLQDGVPETIQLLKLGNIKVWVLTGDKQETAVNIGYACRLLMDDMEILEEKEVRTPEGRGARAGWAELSSARGASPSLCQPGCPWSSSDASQDRGGLVEKAFVELATSCQAMICCRVTPKQKALMVQLVKKHKKAVTLAIGDGANDVNMIKTADIGVGISGLEGLQAVQCSDYALAQFSFLQRLLLVHGRWNYLRICKFLRYFFYKTFAGLLGQVWFAFHSGFTAQPLYEGWFLALYNIFYTAYPVLSVGLLEQDVSAKKSLEFPELYMVGQQDELFNYRVFGVTLLHGVGTSLISFYVALWAFEDHVGTKAVGDYESFSVTVALSALLSVLIVLDTKYWTVLSFLMVTASLLLYCLFSFLTQSVDAFRIAPAIFRFPGEVPQGSFPSLPMVLGAVSHPVDHVLVATSRSIHLKAKRDPEPSVELRSHVPRGSFRRRSSYAFSHQEGYGGLISRGASLRGQPAGASLRGPACGGQPAGASLGGQPAGDSLRGPACGGQPAGDSLRGTASGASLRAPATPGTAPGALRPEETPAVSSLSCPSL
uniref:Phospholipid-transporting ATPase n=1 Tax=Corvus moneduloides TaxID=1196302 RepID=A0A8C3GWF6_CORMO